MTTLKPFLFQVLRILLFLAGPIFVSSTANSTESSLPLHNELINGSCERTLTPDELLEVYRSARYGKLDENWVIGRPRLEKIHNQCQQETCSAEVHTALWEYRARKAFGHDVELSTDHTIRNTLTEKVNNPNLTGPYKLSADDISSGAATTKKSGLAPAGMGKKRFAFQDSNSVVDRMLLDISSVVAYYKSKNQPEMAAEAAKKILDEYFESVPESFIVDGEEFTPYSFRRHILNASNAPKDPVRITMADLGYEKFVKAIATHMEKFGEPVPLAMDWVPAFYDSKRHQFSVNQFTREIPGVGKLDNSYAFSMANKGGVHAVLLWDYSVDQYGTPYGFLALNSAGKDWGDKGYFSVFGSYLREAHAEALVDQSVVPVP